MKTSSKGIELIKSFEGMALKAYKCPAGVWTIGFGHTKGVKSGDIITPLEAEQLLKDDLAVYEAKVNAYDKTYRWSQNEFDALVSFCYNVGSIGQLTKNGTRSKTQIAEHIEAYNKANGKELAGLTRRRKAEKALFEEAEQVAQADVKDMPDNWALAAWSWASQEGLLDGTRPHDTVTRQELAAIMERIFAKLSK